jgi:PAS domain S-box-containing protein
MACPKETLEMILVRPLFALFILIGLPRLAMGAEPYVPSHPNPFEESWRWTIFPELNGHGLRCMAQTQDGTLWFGTDEGVWSYNGTTHRIYTPQDGLLDAPVFVLYATQDGRLYAGTAQGISVYQNGTWARHFPVQGDLPWPINALYETNEGILWAGTGWGLLKADTTHPELYTTDAMAKAIAPLMPSLITHTIPDNIIPKRLWRPLEPDIAGVGIRAIEGSWASLRSRKPPRVIWAVAPNSPAEKAGIQVGDYILAINGTHPAWANDGIKGDEGSQVTLTLKRANQTHPFDITLTRQFINGTFHECPVYTLVEDQNNTLWFALARNQIIRSPINNSQPDSTKTYQLFNHADPQQLNYAPILFKAKDGSLWTASQSGHHGLLQFDGQDWIEKTPPTIATSIVQTPDSILWVSGRSLYAFQNERFIFSKLPSNGPHNYVHMLEAQNGALWFAGTGEGVARFDYQTSRWQTFADLTFYCETPDGTHWFVSDQHQIVSKQTDTWKVWEPTDGALEKTDYLTLTKNNQLIATGYQNGILITAVFDGQNWVQTQHPNSNITGRIRHLTQTADGSLWLHANESIGIFQQTPNGIWHHLTPPEAAAPPECMTQTPDGHIWVGGWFGLRHYNPQTHTWSILTNHTGLTSYIDALHADQNGHLWVGTRLYGIFHFDGQTWTQYNVDDGIADINISRIFSTPNNTIWAVTRNGVSCFDGHSWIKHALPLDLARLMGSSAYYPTLTQTQNNTIWLNISNGNTVSYSPDQIPPETSITSSIRYVSQPGNTTLSWAGTDPWQVTANQNLQFSYRLNNKTWSPFTTQTSDIFLGLSGGNHMFEVRARDADFNIDPTPAQLQFVVTTPVWAQPWFIVMIALLGAAIVWQTHRVMQRNRQVQASHRALEIAINDLQSSEQRLRTVVTNAPVIFWAVDPQGTLTFLQGKEQDVLGLTETDVLSKSVFTLFSQHPNLCKDIQRALKGDAFVSIRELLGTTFEIHHAPLHTEDGQNTGAICVATNIADRVRSESERLRLNEELRQLRYLYRLRVALGQARTPEEVIQQAGNALLKTLSTAVSSFVCLTFDNRDWTFGDPTPTHTYHYHRTLEWGNQARGILAVETGVILTESQERALLDETAGQIVNTLKARELEAQLLQSARLLSLGQMAAGVAHELNQPLAAISATAEGVYLRLESGMSVSRKRMMLMMEDILGLVERMISAIENLRIFSRDSSQERGREFDVNDAVRASIKMMNAQIKSHGIQLILDLDTDLPQTLGHQHQIEQVILNLLSNARDALDETTYEEKHIFIRTHQSHGVQTHMETNDTTPKSFIIIEVKDNGIGIDEKNIPRLFEPFFTTKPVDKGTGIGLSIAFAIVQNHGGEITCSSQKNRQTTFRITLPITKATSPNGQHRSEPTHSAH